MLTLGDVTVTSLDVITCFDITTGNYKFTLDELQNATIEQTQDTVDITGKQGRKLSTIKRNKAVTISGSNGLISGGLLEMQTGSEFENKVTTVRWTDYTIEVNSDVATTQFIAVGTTGDEIPELFVRKDNGMAGERLTQDSAVGEGKFTYDPSTKEIAFNPGDYADGTRMVAYYDRKIQADVLENLTDTYSEKCAMYIDATGEDKCANIYHIQFYIPKADFSGEFTIEFGEDQSVHEFTAESLSGACGLENDVFFTYTLFGEDAEDVTDDTDDGDGNDGDGNDGDGDDGDGDDGDGDDGDGNDGDTGGNTEPDDNP